jgi:dihydroorotate dehydrogenase
MYRYFIRPILFKFHPEFIHDVVIFGFRYLSNFRFILTILRRFNKFDNRLSKDIWNIRFQHPVGLAAGLDKNAEAFEMFGALGFSFVEIGTITPKSQPGNPKPRLFRLPKDKALINRMGFNNLGVDFAIAKLKKRSKNVIIGGNIGKNKLTPNSDAVNDYLLAFRKLAPYVDYVAINISSPNTPGLRDLQHKDELYELLSAISKEKELQSLSVPLLVKLAPDLSIVQLDDALDIIQKCKMDGVIISNTTISRENIPHYDMETVNHIGAGGLSGEPVREKSTIMIRQVYEKTNGRLPIIGVGGIMNPHDAVEKLEAGASLVQLYTGFIYEGPQLIKAINRLLLSRFSK